MFKQKEPWQAVARTMSWSKAGNLGTGRTVFYTLRQVMFNVTVTQCSQKGFLFVFLMCKFTFPQLLIIHRKKKKKKTSTLKTTLSLLQFSILCYIFNKKKKDKSELSFDLLRFKYLMTLLWSKWILIKTDSKESKSRRYVLSFGLT